jgi:hypothetical protein
MIPMMMIWRAGMRTMRKARRKKVGSILLCDVYVMIMMAMFRGGLILVRYCIVLS